MRLGVAFVSATCGFLFGLCFYHYIILCQNIPIISYPRPLHIKTHPSSHHNTIVPAKDEPFKKFVVLPPDPDWIPLNEAVKGPLTQDAPKLINYIRQSSRFLIPPPGTNKTYNLSHPKTEDFSMGQTKMLLRALKDLKNGFFVECGALDGELRSNTLLLERRYNWTGLLIEGDPKNFALLVQKNRNAWLSPACLATHEYPQQVIFEQSFNRGRISNKILDSSSSSSIPAGTAIVQCFPLFSLLAALNVTQVDYLSLDVEGSELAVLETIPFHKMRIKVISVEFLHAPGGREAIRRLMTHKGYTLFGAVRDPVHNWANDLIFLHNSIVY